jgi:succinyl-CoA synthetase beta subunit
VADFTDFDRTTARAIVERARAAGRGWLPPRDCELLLRASGIPTLPTRVVRSAADACAAAQAIGFPVVLKGAGPDLLHKTEAHAVHPSLRDESAVVEAYRALSCHPDVRQVLAQPMVHGVEMLVGASCDAKFGHAVVCGSGGVLVELLRDTACRLAPLTDVTGREMLNELRGIKLLRGYRGAERADEVAFLDVLLRVSALLGVCPEIQELDLNPVIVSASGATAVDVRVRVAQPC